MAWSKTDAGERCSFSSPKCQFKGILSGFVNCAESVRASRRRRRRRISVRLRSFTTLISIRELLASKKLTKSNIHVETVLEPPGRPVRIFFCVTSGLVPASLHRDTGKLQSVNRFPSRDALSILAATQSREATSPSSTSRHRFSVRWKERGKL